MDLQTISAFISSVGFPIVACVALFVMVRDTTNTHKEEIDSLRKTIEDNTIVLTRLESLMRMIDRRGADDGN